jgi:hypothetical protein
MGRSDEQRDFREAPSTVVGAEQALGPLRIRCDGTDEGSVGIDGIDCQNLEPTLVVAENDVPWAKALSAVRGHEDSIGEVSTISHVQRRYVEPCRSRWGDPQREQEVVGARGSEPRVAVVRARKKMLVATIFGKKSE